MKARSYAILGTGAVGGFYGARLHRAGFQTHFLLKSDYQHVRQHGLRVESKDGDFALPRVNAWRDACAMPRCDVVVVALKTTQNHLLPALLPPLVRDDDVAVLVLQNGLGNEEQVATVTGTAPVIGGLCFLCCHKAGPGHVRHLDYGMIELAAFSPDARPVGVTERMRAIAADFERAGIPVVLGGDLALARWKKLVWNIPFNGLSVVLDARTDELMGDDATRALVGELMREVVAGAAACGRTIPDDHLRAMQNNTARMKPYVTSMKLDFDRRQPMELETIFGNPLRAARRSGVSLPRIETLYRQLDFLDRRNRAQAAQTPVVPTGTTAGPV
jgi:2-dehydropantoate 2-reductase